MSRKERTLDTSAVLVGILLGLAVGGGCAMLRVKKSGAVRRKDLTNFGARSVELEIETSLNDAKDLARKRLQDAD